jgi:hypothetical protein
MRRCEFVPGPPNTADIVSFDENKVQVIHSQMRKTAAVKPMKRRTTLCSKSGPATPVYGTGDGLGVESVPLLVAPGAMPVPVPVAPIAPAELLGAG